jgi:WD40 repeat protein
MERSARCPDCGGELSSEPGIHGLCPQCLLSLALEESELGAAKTLDGAALGHVLADRYQMRELLGRGGMGEVWRAFDLKLRMDVALKALRPEMASSAKARELLRQEVRSAREVVSPNVCRIFDLVVEDDQELVSMEFIDGVTLAETLRHRGPLGMEEAREVASQFLSGLEAIHQAGLVHRDFKPENVMVTRAGRVVVMDFGLAKGHDRERTGTISGTPAYMAPEQARGDAVDVRADVFAAGVVLSEMVSVGNAKARQELWERVREAPPRVPEGAWAPVLRKAVAFEPASRYETARALARALEEVTLRLPGLEDKHPYPGLAYFTEEDREFFYGREVDVEALCKKLKRPRLLALIGPSGAGKSSFLRAGLLPALPEGFRVILSTPGHRPFSALAEALVPAFAGDMEAIQSFMRFDEPETALSLFSRWRRGSEYGLVVIDQFEELFTLTPPETQHAFAALLGKLVLEADVHVLLSMRDDFLFHCQGHESLVPVFSELTPLGPLSESSLRRALVQPALSCGYRFEDEALVDEMIFEVSRERGALPLLAFAASRLWEKRDREKGLLTREAYQEIGGVGGALAQHAEETLSRIGDERTPLVRELFRNLVTASGTRASREVDELLSVFSTDEDRKAAEAIVRELVAARLLTSYENTVEIIHESLLSAWPRLVQWRNQDEGGALLRDQLRQSARLWEERGRPEDLLWTGSSYREFALWRERYPGGLSTTEEAFTEAAVRLAGRRRRRRQVALASVIAVLVGVVGIVTSFWRRSVLEVSRREAAQILALGRLQLEDRPAAALAHALASLERADSEEARRFAVEALWHRGAAIFLEDNVNAVNFSPDGKWLATGGSVSGVMLWSVEGGSPKTLGGPDRVPPVRFSPGGDFLAAGGGGAARFWSIPDGKELRRVALGGRTYFQRGGSHLFSFTETSATTRAVRDWSAPETDPEVLSFDFSDVADQTVDATGEWLVTARGNGVYFSSLRERNPGQSHLIGEHDAKVVWVDSHPTAARVVSGDETGEIRIWSVSATSGRLERTFRAPAPEARLDPTDSWMIVAPSGEHSTSDIAYVWDLKGPRDAEPSAVRDTGLFLSENAVHPQGHWLVTGQAGFGVLWPLHGKYPRVVRGPSPTGHVAFTRDGRGLISISNDGTLRLWVLSPGGGERSRILMDVEIDLTVRPALDPSGRFAIAGAQFAPAVFLVPLREGEPREMPGFRKGDGWVIGLALSPDGRLVAASKTYPSEVRIWDLVSGAVRTLDTRVPADETCGSGTEWEGGVDDLEFLTAGRLLTIGAGGLRIWDLDRETSERLRPCSGGEPKFAIDRERNRLLVLDGGEGNTFGVVDLKTRTSRQITSHGNRVGPAAFDPTGTIVVTGDHDGVVRVGPVTGEAPHLLFGHELAVRSVAVSPDGEWIASASADGTIRLWPMPDVRSTPFHTLPYEQILERIRGMINLRVVPDESSDTGYRVDIGPFPGWKKLPDW